VGEHAHGGGPELLSVVGLLVGLVGVAAYLLLVGLTRQRGWPQRRTAAWLIGSGVATVSVVGPLAAAADSSYPHHMVVHLLLGMVAPLLLTLAAPVTLLLRALPVPTARGLSHLLTAPLVRIATEPAVAAVLAVGGMWLLYATPLYAAVHHQPVLHLLLHAHLFIAGGLFAVAIIGIDPMPHRRSHLHRAAVLVLSLAAHDILAKYLYAHPPVGVDAAPAALGSMIMYYGGDVVDVVIMVLLGADWYRASRPRPGRRDTRLVEVS
jgi:putative membrane protein